MNVQLSKAFKTSEPYLQLSEDDNWRLLRLQVEMRRQSTQATPNPRFWAIKQTEWFSCDPDFATSYKLVFKRDDDIMEFNTALEAKEYLDEYMLSTDKTDIIKSVPIVLELLKNDQNKHLSRLIRQLDELNLLDWTLYPGEKREILKENTLFITEKEAQNHLDKNKSLYNQSAHIYCMSALYAPEIEFLWSILLKNSLSNFTINDLSLIWDNQSCVYNVLARNGLFSLYDVLVVSKEQYINDYHLTNEQLDQLVTALDEKDLTLESKTERFI